MENSNHRNYCFTAFTKPTTESDKIKYCIYGEEICPKTKKVHYQGYIELKIPMRLKAVKKIIGECHIEIRKGSRLQAIKYCEKEGKTTIIGKDIGQGHRTDLEEVGRSVIEGKPIEEIARENPGTYIRYNKGIEELKTIITKPPKWRNVKVTVIWGKTGTNKTRTAKEIGKDDYYILGENSNNTLWFDGYREQKTLIIDDFYGWIKWGDLLRLLDGHEYRCQIKGSYRWAFWNEVIITSNKPYKDWYNRQDISALERRINNIKHFE